MHKRNRSEVDKAQQLGEIIDAGRELIDRHGMQFSMRQLAKAVGMNSVSSIYTYIDGKAELWKLVKRHDFEQFDLYNNQRDREFFAEIGNPPELNLDQKVERIINQGDAFITHALEDYARYGRMFILPTPEIENPENHTNEITLQFLTELVHDVLEDPEYQGDNSDPIFLAHSLWAMMMGVTIIIRPAQFGMSTKHLSKTDEKAFREYILDQCRKLLLL